MNSELPTIMLYCYYTLVSLLFSTTIPTSFNILMNCFYTLTMSDTSKHIHIHIWGLGVPCILEYASIIILFYTY